MAFRHSHTVITVTWCFTITKRLSEPIQFCQFTICFNIYPLTHLFTSCHIDKALVFLDICYWFENQATPRFYFLIVIKWHLPKKAFGKINDNKYVKMWASPLPFNKNVKIIAFVLRKDYDFDIRRFTKDYFKSLWKI